MKSKRFGTPASARAPQEIIIKAWEYLGSPDVGRQELLAIQETLRREFDQRPLESPAAIARVLADAGAGLRHPEVIQCDSQWRQDEIERNDNRFLELIDLCSGQPLSLGRAEELIRKMEELRLEFEAEGDPAALKTLQTMAADARQRADSLRETRTGDSESCAEQAELAQWLTIWIQTPNLFQNWLDLRRSSKEFIEQFGNEPGR